ncbi:MAG TPA: hypothetical protein VLC06_22730 [Polyangia bacterium]|nr:hypothetical protein [Polyangia bacterium]
MAHGRRLQLAVVGLLLATLPAGARAETAPASPSAPVVPPVVPLGPTAPIDLRALPLLDGPALYRVLGRPDLAIQYEHRRATKTALRISGGLLLGAGVLVGVVDILVVVFDNGVRTIGCLPADGTGPTSSSCQTPASVSAIPWLVALGGLGMLVAPSFMSTDPLTPAEKRALIDSATGAPPGRPLSLSITPAPTTGGAQLVVGGHF